MPDGTSTVEVLGVKGKRCLKITEELEEELGIITERKAKAEMQEKDTVSANKVQNLHRK